MSASESSENGFAMLKNVPNEETAHEFDKSAKIIEAVCALSRIKGRRDAGAPGSGSFFVGGNKSPKSPRNSSGNGGGKFTG